MSRNVRIKIKKNYNNSSQRELGPPVVTTCLRLAGTRRTLPSLHLRKQLPIMFLLCFYQPIRGGYFWMRPEVRILGADQRGSKLLRTKLPLWLFRLTRKFHCGVLRVTQFWNLSSEDIFFTTQKVGYVNNSQDIEASILLEKISNLSFAGNVFVSGSQRIAKICLKDTMLINLTIIRIHTTPRKDKCRRNLILQQGILSHATS